MYAPSGRSCAGSAAHAPPAAVACSVIAGPADGVMTTVTAARSPASVPAAPAKCGAGRVHERARRGERDGRLRGVDGERARPRSCPALPAASDWRARAVQSPSASGGTATEYAPATTSAVTLSAGRARRRRAAEEVDDHRRQVAGVGARGAGRARPGWPPARSSDGCGRDGLGVDERHRGRDRRARAPMAGAGDEVGDRRSSRRPRRRRVGATPPPPPPPKSPAPPPPPPPSAVAARARRPRSSRAVPAEPRRRDAAGAARSARGRRAGSAARRRRGRRLCRPRRPRRRRAPAKPADAPPPPPPPAATSRTSPLVEHLGHPAAGAAVTELPSSPSRAPAPPWPTLDGELRARPRPASVPRSTRAPRPPATGRPGRPAAPCVADGGHGEARRPRPARVNVPSAV